jgi:hypothetical protein
MGVRRLHQDRTSALYTRCLRLGGKDQQCLRSTGNASSTTATDIGLFQGEWAAIGAPEAS